MNIASSCRRITASWRAIVEHLNSIEETSTPHHLRSQLIDLDTCNGFIFKLDEEGEDDTWFNAWPL
jgi:hypothetical protein